MCVYVEGSVCLMAEAQTNTDPHPHTYTKTHTQQHTQVLGEVKQNVDTQIAWLMTAVNDASTRIAEEEGARKQADEALQNWFDQNQVRAYVCSRMYVCVHVQSILDHFFACAHEIGQ